MTDPWCTEHEWLRCAFHAHTTNSDGELAPRALVKHYERAGYDVVAVTDHWFRSGPPSTDRTLVVPSAELNCVLPGDRDGHVLAFGIADALASLEGERLDLAETAAWITGHGGDILETTPDGSITAARLDLPEGAPYARVQVTDERGGRAWTNPLRP